MSALKTLDDMSKDELVMLVKAMSVGADTEDTAPRNVVTVEVDGLSVDVDLDRANTWKAAHLMTKLTSDIPDEEKLPFMVDFYEFVMGDSFSAVLDHFGGAEVARVDQVIGFVSRVLDATRAKK